MDNDLKSKIVTINKEKSQNIYNHYSSLLSSNQCYTNIFKIQSRLVNWDNEKDKIVYGYILREHSNGFKEATRHCWLFFNEEYIDVTPLNNLLDSLTYIPFIELSRTNYIDLIIENDMFPSLDKVLSNEDEKLANILSQHGYMTCSSFLAKLGISEEEYNALPDDEKHIISLQVMLGLL